MFCTKCGTQFSAGLQFCPNCGAQIREKELSVTLFSQLWIYGMSVFLPPLGFWPGIKYFRSSDPKTKRIGMIALVLSLIATVLTIWATFAFLNIYLGTFSSVLNGGNVGAGTGAGSLF